MGEKIKDLAPIKIGSSELMIELNEGYTKNEGRLIHIQNKHFRYLLKEKQFLQLAATVMRAKSEMEYYKADKKDKLGDNIIPGHKEAREEDWKIATDLASDLNNKGVDYRIIEVGEKYALFVVNNSNYIEYKNAIRNHVGIKNMIHPNSEKLGYIYLYQMRPFELYQKGDTYIEIYFQLPCMSLTDKNWIPLDRAIQSRVWSETKMMNSVKVLDEINYCIYRICWSIFRKEAFSDYDVKLLSNYVSIIKSDESIDLLSKVFFNFTTELVELIENKEFSRIIQAYYEFSNY